MGVLILSALIIYSVTLVAVTILAYRTAARRGFSHGKRCLFAIGGFLVVYLPIFWNHLPTIISHTYLCEREAGVWIYKAADQLKKEESSQRAAFKGERFKSLVERSGPLLVNVWRWQHDIIDVTTDEVLARRIDFSTGIEGRIGGEPELKFWLQSNGCEESGSHAKLFAQTMAQFRGGR